MATLAEIARRLNNPAPFITAILRELGERVVNDLRQNTPGERLPSEWTYAVTTTTLTIFNTRLEADREQWEIIFGFLNHGTRAHFVAPVRAQAFSTAAMRSAFLRVPFSSATNSRYSRTVISWYSGGCSGR